MKRPACIALLALALPGCGESDANGPPAYSQTGGFGGVPGGTGGAVVTGGASATTGGTSAGGSAPVTGGAPQGSGGVVTATGGATATGGFVGNTGGASPGSGGTSAGGSGGAGGSAGPAVPIIPEVSGECPVIKAGTSTGTVMGSSATIIAGEKKEGTGSVLVYFYGTGKLGGVTSLPAAVKTAVTADGGIVFALSEAKNTGGDCSGTGTWGIDDMKVVDQFVACAVKNYGIDPKRIYATGCSAGGLMTGCLGIMRSNYIAAVAPNSGGVTVGYGKLQNPNHAPNAITMNGGTGDNVIVNFGDTSEGYDNYILKYGGFAVNCIHNTGHCGAPAALYSSAWQFLKDHPFGTKPSPYASGLPSGFHSSCKIFTATSRAPLGGY